MNSEIFFVPNTPKMSLPNYLLELVECSDTKERSLYLNNVGWLVNELWNEIISKNRNDKGIRITIANSLGIYDTSIYGYKNNRKSISVNMLYHFILLWARHCKKTGVDVKQKWEQLYMRND